MNNRTCHIRCLLHVNDVLLLVEPAFVEKETQSQFDRFRRKAEEGDQIRSVELHRHGAFSDHMPDHSPGDYLATDF